MDERETTKFTPAGWEYGIRHKRSGEMHRTKMTLQEAIDFMYDPHDDTDWDKLFVMCHRPVGTWEDIDLSYPGLE